MLGNLGPFYLDFKDFHTVDLRDVARAHVHVMEHTAGKGRFIVSPTPEQSLFPSRKLVALFKEKYPEYPVATIPLPSFLLSFNPDKGASEFVGGDNLLNGFDGTKITRELGFQYRYADKMEESIMVMVDAAIELGIVKKGKNISQSELVLYAVAALFALGSTVVFLVRFCSSRSKEKEGKVE